MNGMKSVAEFVATGKFHGLGLGSPLSAVTEKIRVDFIEEADEENLSLRRDYGFIEFHFSQEPEWVVTSGMLELHRIAGNSTLMAEWEETMQEVFPRYFSWGEFSQQYHRIPDAPPLIRTAQGGFVEYRSAATRVSVLVVDGEDGRDDWPGGCDVWSVSLG
ncbi:hypothetical protein ABII15_23680 [Streptomyces sp. HUAS MG91]|uniref:Uncharacterized protein n=1 Tax=Streptomyces tabacisoli TaxID=3156398 RepID=A0AAU8IY59_9ACTN